MIWRATGCLGHISYRATNTMEAKPCAAPLGPAGSPPRDTPRQGPVTLWVCQQNSPCGTVPTVFHVSTPGLRCTDEFATGLLEDFGSLFKQLVLFCGVDGEQDGVGDIIKEMKMLK